MRRIFYFRNLDLNKHYIKVSVFLKVKSLTPKFMQKMRKYAKKYNVLQIIREKYQNNLNKRKKTKLIFKKVKR